MKLDTFFEEHPVFTREELKVHLKSHDSENPKTLEQLINYHLNQENIGQVKRGLFYTVKPGFSAADYPVDLMLVTGKIRDDAVIAYHTAIDLHGHAHSVFHRYTYLTERAKNTRKVEFRNAVIQPVQVPKPLLRNGQERLGVESYDRKGVKVSVTSLERTLVDLLDRPDLGGGWEEIWRSAGGLGYLKINDVIEYVKALENGTIAAKVGFFLEQHRKEYRVKDVHLNTLEELGPNQPRYMDRSYEEGTMISRWNLIVPDYVLEEGWSEF